jgi:hypothetical protein
MCLWSVMTTKRKRKQNRIDKSTKLQIGSRVLISGLNDDYPNERTIAEISPSEKFIRFMGGQWVPKDDVRIIEILG